MKYFMAFLTTLLLASMANAVEFGEQYFLETESGSVALLCDDEGTCVVDQSENGEAFEFVNSNDNSGLNSRGTPKYPGQVEPLVQPGQVQRSK